MNIIQSLDNKMLQFYVFIRNSSSSKGKLEYVVRALESI